MKAIEVTLTHITEEKTLFGSLARVTLALEQVIFTNTAIIYAGIDLPFFNYKALCERIEKDLIRVDPQALYNPITRSITYNIVLNEEEIEKLRKKKGHTFRYATNKGEGTNISNN